MKTVLEALHLWKPDDADLAQQERANATWQGSNFQRLFQSIGNGLATIGASGGPGGQFGMPSAMPMPGAAPMTSQNMSVGPSVSVGDNVVNISMAPTSSAREIASTVGAELQSNRDALLSPYGGS